MTGPSNADIVFAIAEHRRMTDRELAEQIHVDQSTISRVRNKHRNFTRLEQIAFSVVWNLPEFILFPAGATPATVQEGVA